MSSILLTLTTLVVHSVLSAPTARTFASPGNETVVAPSAHVNAPAPAHAGSEAPLHADPRPSVDASALDLALATLAVHVPVQSHPDALRTAFQAYFAYRATHPHRVRKPYLYFVDFGLDYRTPRGYVFDMDALNVVEGPFTVAEGRGSLRGPDGVPTRFSNLRNSNMTSLGLYLTQETYGFSGRSGGRRYHSVGLRLQGLSGEFNDAARARGIVVHGAPYVTPTGAGRSEGCPAMEPARAERLLPRISNGSLVFHFSPRDPRWMRSDPWAQHTVRGAPVLAR